MIRKIKYTQYKSDDFLDDTIVAENEKHLDLHDLYNTCEFNVFKKGDIVSAKYIGIVGNTYAFDANTKDYIRVDTRLNEAKYLANSIIGDVIDVYIRNIDNNNYYISGSIAEIYESKRHKTLTAIGEDVIVECYVKDIKPGGYDVDIYYEGITLPGFMPNLIAGINKLYDTAALIGRTFNVIVENFSTEEGTYVVSRKRYLQTLIPEELKKLETNKIYTGNVTGSTDYGVFVEFNECLTGMIYKSNIDPEWADKLTTIVPGYEIEFYVKDIIKNKIILTQILRDSLWDTVELNQIIPGVVRNIKEVGILVNLDSDTVGLISSNDVDITKFTIGEHIRVKVVNLNRQDRKIYLAYYGRN